MPKMTFDRGKWNCLLNILMKVKLIQTIFVYMINRGLDMDVFVARQPIFDKHKQVIAYELLYRNGSKNYFDPSIQTSKATSILLMNTYLSIGIENLIENNLASINFDQKLIESDIPLLLDKNKVVLELQGNIIPSKTFIEKVKFLKSKGYIIALDDFRIDCPYKELIDICDVIKVDFLDNTKNEIKDIYNKYRNEKKRLVAKKVETYSEFDWAKNIGFDYFQGYFFSKPVIFKNKGIKDNALNYIRILNELNKDEPSYSNICNIIEQDVNITYKLLKLVNSKFALREEIDSVNHALTLLGLKEIEKWISLIMIQDLGKDRPHELIKMSLFRSKFGELLAKNSIYKNKEHEMILLGLLSVIDVILQQPIDKILTTLPLTQDIKNTLTGKESAFTDIYKLMLLYENASWNDISTYANQIKIYFYKLPKIYFEAVKWTDKLFYYLEKISTESKTNI